MLLRQLTVVLLAAAAIVLGGCPPQGESNSLQGELGAVVTTSIPPGIYTGEMSVTTKNQTTGEAPTEKTETQPYDEIVNENGLPLWEPGDIVPRTRALIPVDLGGESQTFTIDGVETSGNRLVITYTGTITVDGLDYGGFGNWVYEFTAPSTLGFTHQFQVSSDAVNGRIMSYWETASGTLTK